MFSKIKKLLLFLIIPSVLIISLLNAMIILFADKLKIGFTIALITFSVGTLILIVNIFKWKEQKLKVKDADEPSKNFQNNIITSLLTIFLSIVPPIISILKTIVDFSQDGKLSIVVNIPNQSLSGKYNGKIDPIKESKDNGIVSEENQNLKMDSIRNINLEIKLSGEIIKSLTRPVYVYNNFPENLGHPNENSSLIHIGEKLKENEIKTENIYTQMIAIGDKLQGITENAINSDSIVNGIISEFEELFEQQNIKIDEKDIRDLVSKITAKLKNQNYLIYNIVDSLLQQKITKINEKIVELDTSLNKLTDLTVDNNEKLNLLLTEDTAFINFIKNLAQNEHKRKLEIRNNVKTETFPINITTTKYIQELNGVLQVSPNYKKKKEKLYVIFIGHNNQIVEPNIGNTHHEFDTAFTTEVKQTLYGIDVYNIDSVSIIPLFFSNFHNLFIFVNKSTNSKFVISTDWAVANKGFLMFKKPRIDKKTGVVFHIIVYK